MQEEAIEIAATQI